MKKLFYSVCFCWLSFLGMSQQTRVYFLESKMDGSVDFATASGPIRDLPFWGYGEPSLEGTTEISLPGPHIEANEGDSVHVYMFNPSEEGHTIHFHGLDVDQANDGVPSTSRFVLNREAAWYKFKATHAGNYIYHCHVTTTMHLILGMYGMVTIHPSNAAQSAYTDYGAYTKDYSYLAVELDSRWNEDYINIGSFLDYEPDIFSINGKSYTDIYSDSSMVIQAQQNDTVLLRLRNIGYGPQDYHFPADLNAEIIGSDGRKIIPAIRKDTLRLYPGERYSVLFHFENMDSSAVTVDFLSSNGLELIGREYIPINSFEFIAPKSTISIDENADQSFKVYPNPSAGQINLKLPKEPIDSQVQIFDMKNQLQASYPLLKELDLRGLPAGLYFIKIPGLGSQKLLMTR